MLYKTSNRDLVYKEIKKLKPLKYNQFKWWRRFNTKALPLPKGATFLQRIQNGEYEFSHYFWQWKLTEIELNDLYEKYNGNVQEIIMSHSVDLARRKRLIEDFNKDEADRLEALKKGFLREFDMTSDDYEDSLTNFDGTTEEFYVYCLKNFERSGRPIERRGRPKKIV